MIRKKNKSKKGFTLIELVIVLAVIGIISLIAIPNLTKVKNDAKFKSDKMSAKQIAKTINIAIESLDNTQSIPGTFYTTDSNIFSEYLINVNKPALKDDSYKVTIENNIVKEVDYRNGIASEYTTEPLYTNKSLP